MGEQEIKIIEPRNNFTLFGHELAQGEICNALTNGRLHHAWLFSGLKGVGKATLAFRMARYMLRYCRPINFATSLVDEQRDDPIENLEVGKDDQVFAEVSSGCHPQLLYIEKGFTEKGQPRAEITIDQIRKVAKFFQFTSTHGDWRIVIIDGAEEMNHNAENALLKIIEEPPKFSLIILISHSLGKLLQTTRSRCRILNLKPLASEHVGALLRLCHPELPNYDLTRLTMLGDGSPGRAIQLADGHGLELYNEIRDLFMSFPNFDDILLSNFINKFARKDTNNLFATAINLICWWIENIIITGARGSVPDYIPGEEAELLCRLAENGGATWLNYRDKMALIFEMRHLD